MNITVSQAQGRVPVTVLCIEGDLDGSNYQDVIARAKELYAAGTRHLLLDLTNTPYMSSAGLVALHGVTLLLRGEEPPSPENGWSAFHAISRDQTSGHAKQHGVKLLNPQPRVDKLLDKAGLKDSFEIYNDLQTAVASFS